MTEPSATALPGTAPAPPARLEPDAIDVAQDTIIGMATSAPAAVVAITLASLAVTADYGGGATLLISAVPMLIIANAYRRLNNQPIPRVSHRMADDCRLCARHAERC